MVETCRELISTVSVALNSARTLAISMDSIMDPEKSRERFIIASNMLDMFARWLAAFPIAAKNFLRSRMDSRITGWDDEICHAQRRIQLSPIFNEEEVDMIMEAKHPVLLVLDRLRSIIYDMCFVVDLNFDRYEGANLYLRINSELDQLSRCWGVLEKISSTPVAFVYVAYLRSFLLLYLMLFNMYSIANGGWTALIVNFAGEECATFQVH